MSVQRRSRSRVVMLAALSLGVLATSASRADAPAPPDPLPLAWCLERAAQANPEIAAKQAEAEAAARRVRPAGSLEDPRLAYTAMNIPVSAWELDASPMSGNQIELRQKLPFPGLLGNREAAARAAAEASGEEVRDQRLRVAAAVERSWAALGFAQRALEITDSNIELLRQIAKIAEVKYRVGAGLQQDVMRAQVELTLRLGERLRRVATLRAQEARLSALLDLSIANPLPRTETLRDTVPLPDLDLLLERLPETSPRLQAFAKQVVEEERAQRAVQLEGYPDFDLGIGYRLRNAVQGDPVSGDDFLSAGLTIRLPIDRGKWRDRIAERDALLRRAKASQRGALAQLRDDVRATYADLQRADAAVALFETGLLPQARESLESSRSGYEVDKVDFLSLLDSQIKLLNAEFGLVRAVTDRRVAFAALEGAVGEALR
ncbi:MAG: TolC family protein [Myxococcales bacterium]|nr:TolC family protein [Myxococcales bacterium]MDH5566578.1 TolC family protein [Myxococcales bacterium]